MKILCILCVFLSSCASVAGYAGAHPAVIECKGKGAITGTAGGPMAAGNFAIQADCGDGFTYRQTGATE